MAWKMGVVTFQVRLFPVRKTRDIHFWCGLCGSPSSFSVFVRNLKSRRRHISSWDTIRYKKLTSHSLDMQPIIERQKNVCTFCWGILAQKIRGKMKIGERRMKERWILLTGEYCQLCDANKRTIRYITLKEEIGK